MLQEYADVIKAGRKKPIWQRSASTRAVYYNKEALQYILPHRDPFLLLDAVTEVDLDQNAVGGRRRIDRNDPVFAGHFPGDPVYPGVLMIEMVAQTGVCLLHFVGRQTCEIPPDGVPPRVRALKVHHVSFLAELHPGDEVDVIAKMLNDDDLTLVCAGQLWKGPTLCALVIIEGVLMESPTEDSRAGS